MRFAAVCLSLLLLYLIIVPAAAWAGLIIRNVDGTSEYYQDGVMAIYDEENLPQLIWDTKKNQMFWFNSYNKVYAETNPDEFIKVLADWMAEGVTDEEGQPAPKPATPPKKPTVVVTKTGSGGKVAGFDTDRYEVNVNGSVIETILVAPTIDLGKEGFATAKIGKQIVQLTRAFGFSEFRYEEDPAYTDLWSKGYPLKTVQKEEGEEYEFEVSKVETGAKIEDKNFKPPAEFKKQPLKQVMESESNE